LVPGWFSLKIENGLGTKFPDELGARALALARHDNNINVPAWQRPDLLTIGIKYKDFERSEFAVQDWIERCDESYAVPGSFVV
jgi:hypothetical protein